MCVYIYKLNMYVQIYVYVHIDVRVCPDSS